MDFGHVVHELLREQQQHASVAFHGQVQAVDDWQHDHQETQHDAHQEHNLQEYVGGSAHVSLNEVEDTGNRAQTHVQRVSQSFE